MDGNGQQLEGLSVVDASGVDVVEDWVPLMLLPPPLLAAAVLWDDVSDGGVMAGVFGLGLSYAMAGLFKTVVIRPREPHQCGCMQTELRRGAVVVRTRWCRWEQGMCGIRGSWG